MKTTASLDPKTTLAQIVLDHPECAPVFRQHRLDFCCRGEIALAAACAESGIDLEAMTAALAGAIDARSHRSAAVDLRRLSTAELVDHIVERHHVFLRRTLPHAEQLARKVSRVHGDKNTKLRPLAESVVQLRESLEPHLEEEECTVFPRLVSGPLADPPLRAELHSMQEDHLRVGDLLHTIRTFADDFAVPEWACGSYRALMDILRELERDTLEHIHVENHVLLPRAQATSDARQPAGAS